MGKFIAQPGYLRVQRGFPQSLHHYSVLQPTLRIFRGGDSELQQRAGVLPSRHHSAPQGHAGRFQHPVPSSGPRSWGARGHTF